MSSTRYHTGMGALVGPGHRIAVRAGAIVLSVTVGLGLAESLLHIAVPQNRPAHGLVPEDAALERNLCFTGDILARHAYTQVWPGGGYGLVPGYAGGSFRVNRWGLRGPELEVPKPPDTYRVLCVGDSVTFGLVECASYPERMHARLAARPPGLRRIEVGNAGVEGYTAKYVLLALERRLFALEPDLLVVMVGWNDIYNMGAGRFAPEGDGGRARFASSQAQLPWVLRVPRLGQYAARLWYGVIQPGRVRAALAREAATWPRGEALGRWDATSAATLLASGFTTPLPAALPTDGAPGFVTPPTFLLGAHWLRTVHADASAAESVSLYEVPSGSVLVPLTMRHERAGGQHVVDRLYNVSGHHYVAVRIAADPAHRGEPAFPGLQVSLSPAQVPHPASTIADAYESDLEAIVRAARARGVRVALATLPSAIGPHLSSSRRAALQYPVAYPHDYEGFAALYGFANEAIREAAARTGVPCIDAAGLFARPDVEDLIFDHCHPTCEGVGVLGAFMAEQVVALAAESGAQGVAARAD